MAPSETKIKFIINIGGFIPDYQKVQMAAVMKIDSGYILPRSLHCSLQTISGRSQNTRKK